MIKGQHPGFARLPLLLLPEGERVEKRIWGPCILAGGEEEEEEEKTFFFFKKINKKKYPDCARPHGPHFF